MGNECGRVASLPAVITNKSARRCRAFLFVRGNDLPLHSHPCRTIGGDRRARGAAAHVREALHGKRVWESSVAAGSNNEQERPTVSGFFVCTRQRPAATQSSLQDHRRGPPRARRSRACERSAAWETSVG